MSSVTRYNALDETASSSSSSSSSSASFSSLTTFRIIGGGPVGFNAACLLAKLGHSVVIYEGRDEIPNNPEESYPIGINPRAFSAMRLVDPALADLARDTGRVVDAWQIYGGSRMVADLKSGVVYGTSRGQVNLLLFEHAKKMQKKKDQKEQTGSGGGSIFINFGYKLHAMDFGAKILEFTLTETASRQNGGKNTVHVDASKDRIIAADGLYSKVRREMEGKTTKFTSTFTKWNTEFRVLFSNPGVLSEEVDEKVHYIFNGFYCATVTNQGKQQWTLVMRARDSDPAPMRKVVLSNDPSPSNLAGLRTLIDQNCPKMSPLISDEELTRYYSRRSYRGAVVRTSRLHEEEWVVLLGDAAHSVFPATGEGINSGLEDTEILYDCVRTQPATAFADFNARRLAAVRKLAEYAEYLNEDPSLPGEAGSRVMFTILTGLCCPWGESIHDELFGPTGEEKRPYDAIVGRWETKKMILHSISRLCCIPIASAVYLVSLPFRGLYYGLSCLVGWCDSSIDDSFSVDDSIKPTVG